MVAAMFWLVHRLNTVYTLKRVAFPVHFINTPYRKLPLKQLPSHLELDVKGNGLALIWLQLSETPVLEIDFNLIGHNDSYEIFSLKPEHIHSERFLDLNIGIKQIYPNRFVFSEAGKFSKILPVKIPLNLHFKPGYELISIQSQPEYIRLFGDSSVLKSIDTVFTMGLTQFNTEKGFETSLSLILPDSGIRMDVQKINCEIQVGRWTQKSVLKKIHVLGNCPDMKIFPETVSVRFLKLESENTNAATDNLKVCILPDCNKNFQNCEVFAGTIPPDCKRIKFEPSLIQTRQP
jgi:hypothetical protein